MNLESRQRVVEEVKVDVDRQEQGEWEDEQEETSLEHQYFL